MPSTLPSALRTISPLILRTTLRNKYYYYPHLTDKETEVLTTKVNLPEDTQLVNDIGHIQAHPRLKAGPLLLNNTLVCLFLQVEIPFFSLGYSSFPMTFNEY